MLDPFRSLQSERTMEMFLQSMTYCIPLVEKTIYSYILINVVHPDSRITEYVLIINPAKIENLILTNTLLILLIC